MADQAKPRPGIIEEFLADWRVVWPQIPNKALFGVLLLVWLALFHFLGNATFGYFSTPSLLGWLNQAYGGTNSEDGQGQLIPFAVLALLWLKRREILAAQPRLWPPALVMLALALMLHLAGYLIQQPRVSAVALFAGIYALVGVVWGWQWMKRTAFPMVMFAFSIPMGTVILDQSHPLRVFSTQVAVGIGRTLLGIPVLRDGTRMLDSNGQYFFEVDAACSGVRSLIAIVAFGVALAFVAFNSPWRRLGMIALAVPMAVAGNVLRLLVILIAAEAWGQKAGNYVHDNLGVIPYIPAFVVMLAVTFYFGEPAPKISKTAATGPAPTA